MKRRKIERVERRRPATELNLVSEVKTRSAKASKGCASLLSRLFVGALLMVLLVAGLS